MRKAPWTRKECGVGLVWPQLRLSWAWVTSRHVERQLAACCISVFWTRTKPKRERGENLARRGCETKSITGNFNSYPHCLHCFVSQMILWDERCLRLNIPMRNAKFDKYSGVVSLQLHLTNKKQATKVPVPGTNTQESVRAKCSLDVWLQHIAKNTNWCTNAIHPGCASTANRCQEVNTVWLEPQPVWNLFLRLDQTTTLDDFVDITVYGTGTQTEKIFPCVERKEPTRYQWMTGTTGRTRRFILSFFRVSNSCSGEQEKHFLVAKRKTKGFSASIKLKVTVQPKPRSKKPVW